MYATFRLFDASHRSLLIGYCLVLLTFSFVLKKNLFVITQFSKAYRSLLIGYCFVLLTFFSVFNEYYPSDVLNPNTISCAQRTVPRLLFGELKITSGYFEVVDEQVVQKLRGNTLKLEGTVRETCQFLHGVG